MIANQGSLLTSSNLFGIARYKLRKDLWVVRRSGMVVRCSEITC